MSNLNIKKNWRKLDNTAKVFSLEEKSNNNTFRLSIILNEKIKPQILKVALKKTLISYPNFKVKMKSGLFWNYLEHNFKEPIIERENETPCEKISLKDNNEYLFKITYFEHKINLDIFHVLTDGVGAIEFLKEIVYNYLDLKYNINSKAREKMSNLISNDQYLINVDKKIIFKNKYKKAYLIREKSSNRKNKTYHYILNLEKFKNICKKLNLTITEYLTAIYIEALYKSVYDKKSKKDLIVTVPINLRNYFRVKSLSNFFTCMNIESNIKNKKQVTFNEILNQVHAEFKSKLTMDNIKQYLSRDVKLGTNIILRLVPLSIKKLFFEKFGKLVNQAYTTTLSNIGTIKFDEKYKSYINNVMVLVSVGKFQKVKCSVCSFDNKLTVTVNSSLLSSKLENEFSKALKKHVGSFKIESNIV